MQTYFHKISEFLDSMEEQYPIPTHPHLFDQWEQDVRELLEETLGEELSVKEEQVFTALLHMRKDAHAAARSLNLEKSTKKDESWKWLLSADQVEQRTADWHKEKLDLLTASEISALWSTPRQRGRLVLSKVAKEDQEDTPFTTRLAVRRAEGNAMDWGVRYEPVVKMHLEKTLGIKISDLGRIRHQSVKGLAASPDGLITEAEGSPELLGRLVEIKCPPSRQIEESKVPFEYWCQMQIQMEVCDRSACEYVEVKIKELNTGEGQAGGYITLEEQEETGQLQYKYHPDPLTPVQEDGWKSVETYGYVIEKVRRTTELRDRPWFESIQKDITAFWNDVYAARAGTWQCPPPSRVRTKKEVQCQIVDTSSLEEPTQD